ncbi:hypothetical protein COCON_G00119200 [Conger conger]|uniref:Uncharacterized protein n=1 Tax=Conger conger TaxID=82655 RepID=A0A9Q1DGL4_CONCO|nr:hypothetical protein COCON_G00119200 [Conger conger]
MKQDLILPKCGEGEEHNWAIVNVPGQRGGNVTICATISHQWTLHPPCHPWSIQHHPSAGFSRWSARSCIPTRPEGGSQHNQTSHATLSFGTI